MTVATEAATSPSPLKLLMFQTFACTMAMMAFTTLAGPIGRSLGLAAWQMGLAVTAGGIAWILTAHPWGKASDRRGRRPILLIGLAGFAMSYGGLCLSASLALRGWLPPLAALAAFIVWRGLSGGFYAAVPAVGTALIADRTAKEQRSRAIATLGIASGVSMVFGPALAALFATHSLEAPLYLMALLPTVGFFAIDRLGLTPQQGAGVAGIALTCVGVALTLAQGAVRRFNWPPAQLIPAGVAVAAGGFIVAGLSHTAPVLYAGYFVAAVGMGLAWPSISALAANAVGPYEQGAAAGAVSAAQGLGTIVGPTVGAAVYGLTPSAPYFLVAALLLGLAVWSRSDSKK